MNLLINEFFTQLTQTSQIKQTHGKFTCGNEGQSNLWNFYKARYSRNVKASFLYCREGTLALGLAPATPWINHTKIEICLSLEKILFTWPLYRSSAIRPQELYYRERGVNINKHCKHKKKKDNRKCSTLTGKANVNAFSCDRPYLIRYIGNVFPNRINQRTQQISEHKNKGWETVKKQVFLLNYRELAHITMFIQV